MCGIAGLLTQPGGRPPDLDRVWNMVGCLRHRGPDEAGIYIDETAALGHARLSIIDLKQGLQPIHNEDRTLWIVYNGEVFNYLELRQDLIQKGHRFYTECDTEVLLHLFEEYGTGCFSKLVGQFSLAIWDSRRKELILARDRTGIRPLYVARTREHVLFASEIKALLAVGEVEAAWDDRALSQTFTFWTTLPGRTPFQGIEELPPGHFARVRPGEWTQQAYWTWPFCPPAEQEDAPVESLAEGVLSLLQDAVRIRLRADVPVGCYVSGGLDSSGVASLIRRVSTNHLRTFGLRFEEAAFDEGEHQRAIVEWLGVDHTEVHASNDAIGASMEAAMDHIERPILRTAPVPLFLLSRAVHEARYKVVLTGEGADEVFGGYNIFREAKVRRFCARQPGSRLRPRLIGRLYPYLLQDSRRSPVLQAFFARGLEQSESPFFSHLIRWQNTSRIQSFFSDDLKNRLGSYDPREELLAQLPPRFGDLDYFGKAQFLETSLFLSNYLLSSQGDRVAMAHSVEIRLPYLDHRVIEFMARVPSRYKIFGMREKYLLKKAFRGLLPEPVLAREKHPYRAPIRRSLLGGTCSALVRDLLGEEALRDAGLFHAQRVGRLLAKLETVEQPAETEEMALVGILTTQMLHRSFVQGRRARTASERRPDVVFDMRRAAARP